MRRSGTLELFERAATQARRKNDTPMLDVLRLELFSEGLAAQIMYFGPYATESPTIVRQHRYIHDPGYASMACDKSTKSYT